MRFLGAATVNPKDLEERVHKVLEGKILDEIVWEETALCFGKGVPQEAAYMGV